MRRAGKTASATVTAGKGGATAVMRLPSRPSLDVTRVRFTAAAW